MVVVSGSWVKTVVPCSPEIMLDSMSENNAITHAKAVLSMHHNSHPFQPRALNLDQSIKIGRSVARAKPTRTNAIFDCKVLSRHHALLWYEYGKFYLQDTKSSNGTFVNDKKLSVDKQEVFSGDVVQFGVDVVENNRKVTHGCIITTLKLYLPDGSEAKAISSPQGVHLADLYRLRQILQEANQREICLESKLNALQRVVEQTKNSAEECWQVYVGEERLLSRISALEIQLQQARANWSEDQLKEEITKLEESNEQYQVAAKEALQTAHEAKINFESVAEERERQKLAAERNTLIARETLRQTQQEIQALAQTLSETQASTNEQKLELKKEIRDLQQQLQEAHANNTELESKIYELTVEISKMQYNYNEQHHLISDDCKTKEELLAENEISESLLNKSNENENQINLTVSQQVAPVEENSKPEKTEDFECENSKEENEQPENSGKERQTRVTFNLNEEDKEEKSPTAVDEKTLKYQYQSAQIERYELRRKIDFLEKISEANKAKIVELTKSLSEEKELSGNRLAENEKLRQELMILEQKWMDCYVENEMLQSKINSLIKPIEKRDTEEHSQKYNIQEEGTHIEEVKEASLDQSNVTTVTCEQLMNMEEELVLLKEKLAQSNEERGNLQRDLLKLKVERDVICDNMYNKLFFYIGPLALIVLYLLISACIS